MSRGLIWSAAALVAVVTCYTSSGRAETFVRMGIGFTEAGSDHVVLPVYVHLLSDRPLTKRNFERYVDAGLYDGTFFHRYIEGFVLQGGGFIDPEQAIDSDGVMAHIPVDLDGDPDTSNPTLDNEYDLTPHRSNVRGTLAMAKLGGDPDSATNQFFFNLADNSANLDNQNGGFTVFAEVVGTQTMDRLEALFDPASYQDYYDRYFVATDLNPDELTIQYDQYGNPISLISEEPDGIRDPGAFSDVPVASEGVGGDLPRLRILEASTTTVDPGDANLDGRVDEADLAWLADGWHLHQDEGVYDWLTADFTGDGNIDEDDLLLLESFWKGADGGVHSQFPQSVPEPMTLLLLGAGVVCVPRRSR